LGLAYLDTGAMFRALALRLGEGGHLLPEAELDARLAAMRFGLTGSGEATRLLVDGQPLPAEARTEKVGGWASQLAVRPVVRARDCWPPSATWVGKRPCWPKAGTWAPWCSRKRRSSFFSTPPPKSGPNAGNSAHGPGQAGRLRRHSRIHPHPRQAGPGTGRGALRPAADAVVIDTSDLTEDAVLGRIVAVVRGAAASS
jgi:cytidylate kinase